MSWNRMPMLNEKDFKVLTLKLYFNSFQTLNKHFAYTLGSFFPIFFF